MLSITRLFFPRLRQNPHHYEAFSVVLRRTLTIRTGRTTAEKLGLQMSWPAAYVLRGKEPPAATTAGEPAAA